MFNEQNQSKKMLLLLPKKQRSRKIMPDVLGSLLVERRIILQNEKRTTIDVPRCTEQKQTNIRRNNVISGTNLKIHWLLFIILKKSIFLFPFQIQNN